MTAMFEMTVFQEWKDPSPPKRDDGWQFAPLRLIFDIKHDGRHKARMVHGGHVTDASGFNSYASTVKTENVCLIFYLSVRADSEIITGDISTAYLYAITKEKLYTRAGPEFAYAGAQYAHWVGQTMVI
jgi:hypothetical protein